MTVAGGINAEVKALGIVLSAVESLTEEQRQFVLKTAVERFKVSVVVTPTNKAPPDWSTNMGIVPTSNDASTNQSPRQFMAAKRPTNDVQRVACLAYYLTHFRSQSHFKTMDLTALNLEAASTKIGNPAQAVANATKISGYLALAGGGKKQLTVSGEAMVAALPDQDAARVAAQEQGASRPKRTRKTKKTKV